MDSNGVSDENVQMILAMGFPSESEVRRALRMAKNDPSDAVAILTNEPTSSYDVVEDMDVDLKEGTVTTNRTYGPQLPPSYEEVCHDDPDNDLSANEGGTMDESNIMEFPVTNLYELEGRVFTEMWNIPFKREESLGKCLIASTRLMEAGLVESDEHCKRFIDRCMPEAFTKLLTSNAVHKWGIEIQEGIFNMLGLLIELVVSSLKQPTIYPVLMDCLKIAFNPDTEFQMKNKNKRREDRSEYSDLSGAISHKTMTGSFCWLAELIGMFTNLGGFELVKKHLDSENVDILNMSLLLRPFGVCASFLSQSTMDTMLRPGMEKAVKTIQALEEKDFKDKKIGSVSDLLSSMKLLCLQMWREDVDKLDDLRLDVTLRMLKSPHFNAKMNALKEVTKLIDELGSRTFKSSAIVIPESKLLDWLVENKVLSIALEGNIDQAQYCDKIKGIVDFLGSKLSLDELSMIWKMQNGQTSNVIDNIHSIIAAAAVKFEFNQLEHLFLLIQKKWQDDNDKTRDKLLTLIGKIGKDAKVSKTTTKVLELLWDLAHLPSLSTALVEQALDEHHAILSDSYSVKEQIKMQYVNKCVEDIKKGACVLPALKQLMLICKSIIKNPAQKGDNKGVINELNKGSDIIKLVTNSLVKCHKQAASLVGDGQLKTTTMVDGRYTHVDYIAIHLNFLLYILQAGDLYLPWNRARDIWTTLVANPKACDWDRETCYDWFQHEITDLEIDTQNQMFQKMILCIDPSKLSESGFKCFKCFFEGVNIYEHRLKNVNSTLVVEKPDLIGLDYLWEICLHVPSENIAEQAIQLLLSYSYSQLNSKLKKEPLALHKKFINECYTRLETARMGLGGNVVAQTVSNATKVVTAAIVPDVANVPLPSRSVKFLAIERLLWIAESYILSVEEIHCVPRNILPHGASFHGYQLNLLVKCEALKVEFTLQCHSNETLSSVRKKVFQRLNQPVDHVQMHTNDKLLCMTKDQLLLHQLDITDNSVLQVHLGTSSTSKSSSTSMASGPSGVNKEVTTKEVTDGGEGITSQQQTSSSVTSKLSAAASFGKEDLDKGASSTVLKQTFDIEQEKMLPGVVMAKGGEVFEMLYQLTELDEPKITKRVQKLLMLIPTDQAVSDALDLICHKQILKSVASSEDLSGVKSSPKKSAPTSSATVPVSPKETIRNLFDCNKPDMSAFRVLYNLEVLSCKLMPTSEDLTTQASAQNFCVEFLHNGGLSLVVSVLQPESLPAEINYEIRQGCYSICLQLARYLLCGQTVIGKSDKDSSILAPSPIKTSSKWSHAIQNLSTQEFVETISCFMKVTWAAAAGRLHLLSYNQPIKESREGFSCGHRSRQSSTGSSASTNSDSDNQSLHAGVCAHQINIPTQDAQIAKEALEILITCLQLRKELLASFYTLPYVSDFILDLLVSCPLKNIRDATLEQLYLLSQLDVSQAVGSDAVQSPKQFILQMLLKAFVPFWVSSSNARGSTQKLLNQCSQYFELRCRLLENLTFNEQQKLGLHPMSMLDDEVIWLCNFVPSRNGELSQTDNTLLAGHLKLMRTLATCEGVEKSSYGGTLVNDLLHDFLFPASKLMLDSMNQTAQDSNLMEFNPKCSNSESRVAAYDLLAELTNKCSYNLRIICKELLMMHHQYTDNKKEWEYMPPVDGRASCGYVGLKNGGATCYMNSVLQQLYMTPGVPEAILSVDEDQPDEDSVFYQVQQMFGHLMESRLQAHEPEKFWQVFKLWGHSINIREQQDSFDFFQAVLDQIDEHMKELPVKDKRVKDKILVECLSISINLKPPASVLRQIKAHKISAKRHRGQAIGREEIFKKKFQGIFSDQKICKDCPHRYEREEAFIALNLTVKNATLQDSLDQFVKEELLEGVNAYFCEKCGEKRNAIKRMCIKMLPPLLCIQLKRFGYDWEANRALKFDDYFKFPWRLDMEPYTVEGMARREGQQMDRSSTSDNQSSSSSNDGDGGNSDSLNGEIEAGIEAASINSEPSPIQYDLVGIVVHSGQANAGHYYSFIRDRRGTVITNPNKGKWFKFNDTVVEEFDMNDVTVEQECFGGTYKAKVYDSSNTYPEERLRYWNGYLLFYEKLDDMRSPVTAKRSKIISRRVLPEGGKRSSDSLMELTELVHKGERKGIFLDRMPAGIQQMIHAENITFVKNRDIYNPEYFTFIKQLVSIVLKSRPTQCQTKEDDSDYSVKCIECMQLSIRFLVNTYLRTRLKTQSELDEWVVLLENLMHSCKEACLWFIDYLASLEGCEIIKPFILESTSKEVRVMFGKLLERTFASFYYHGGVPTHPNLNTLLETLLSLLDKDAVDLVRNSTQYFLVLRSYIQLGTKACAHMFGRNGFQRLVNFLLGNGNGESGRRWSSIQAREFTHLHTALALLILNCDVKAYQTHEPGSFGDRKPSTVQPHIFLKMSAEMSSYVFGEESHRYIKEVVTAVRELSGGTLQSLYDMLLYCCYCNFPFTKTLLKQIMCQYSNIASNELKPIFMLLTEILSLEDPLQTIRLQYVIDGFLDEKEKKFEGLTNVIRLNHVSDSRRSYQCIKFLVSLMNQSAVAKEFLVKMPMKWQWAVNWLKKKMSDHYWSTTSSPNLSNEDSNRKSFQRTYSAQHTLQEATALLTEMETQEFNNNNNVTVTAMSSGEFDVDVNLTMFSSSEASTNSGTSSSIADKVVLKQNPSLTTNSSSRSSPGRSDDPSLDID